MRFASLLHPVKHIQNDAVPRQQSTPFPKVARAAICTLLAVSLTVAGAPSALAQDDATQQAVVKSEGAAESHSAQSQQMPASEPEPEPAQTVEPENEPAAPAGDAAPGDPADDTAADTPAEGDSPAANDDAAGASPSSENPTSSQTPSLDANAEPLSDAEAEAEEGEEEEEEPEAQAETRAGGTAEVNDWEGFERALKDASVSTINITGTINDGVFDSEQHCSITRSVEITSSNASEIWYTWLYVESGATLTLSGNLYVNGDRINGSQGEGIDPVTVRSGGILHVGGSVKLTSNWGASDRNTGIGVIVESGGYADIATSSEVHGSSGAVWVKPGGTCKISGSGEYGTKNDLDSGHAAIDNHGSLTIQDSPIIDSLENTGDLSCYGASFQKIEWDGQNIGDDWNSIPWFNNKGTAWLYGCSFTTVAGAQQVAQKILSPGSTYVYAPEDAEGSALKVNGTHYYVGAPTIAWSGEGLSFTATSASGTENNRNRRYLGSNTTVNSLSELKAAVDDNIEDKLIVTAAWFNESTSVDPSGSTAANMPYALAAFDFPVDGGDFFHVFGPTSELNIMSVDVQ
ncbi:MAG TPA: hypothetical protein IAB86_02160 [Candidatus Aphodovivens avicola]|nr:hypothetical protein [Candidatus Aphodovivens avicola]